jgi:hypothetical protein
MRDQLHQSERQESASGFKTVRPRAFVLLKILNSGKCFVFLNHLLAKSIGE